MIKELRELAEKQNNKELFELLNKQMTNEKKIQELIIDICQLEELEPAKFLESRKYEIRMPRFALIKLMKEHGFGLSWIGRQVGKDHTTIMHTCQECENLAFQHEYLYLDSYKKVKELFKNYFPVNTAVL